MFDELFDFKGCSLTIRTVEIDKIERPNSPVLILIGVTLKKPLGRYDKGEFYSRIAIDLKTGWYEILDDDSIWATGKLALTNMAALFNDKRLTIIS